MFKCIFCLISLLIVSESAKILGVFPIPSVSHQVLFRTLMLELAKRRHEVRVITTDPAFPKGQTPQNLTEIDLHDISYEGMNKFMTEDGNQKDPQEFVKSVTKIIFKLFEKQYKSADVQKLLRDNKKFDLLFIESLMQPSLIFSHIYKAPVIEFSSLSSFLTTFGVIGAATHPIIYPDVLHIRIYNLTLWKKISELYYSSERIFTEHVLDNKILKTIIGPDVPDLKDLKRNVQMLFLIVHPIWDFNL